LSIHVSAGALDADDAVGDDDAPEVAPVGEAAVPPAVVPLVPVVPVAAVPLVPVVPVVADPVVPVAPDVALPVPAVPAAAVVGGAPGDAGTLSICEFINI
jgi:hypothetical protein